MSGGVGHTCGAPRNPELGAGSSGGRCQRKSAIASGTGGGLQRRGRERGRGGDWAPRHQIQGEGRSLPQPRGPRPSPPLCAALDPLAGSLPPQVRLARGRGAGGGGGGGMRPGPLYFTSCMASLQPGGRHSCSPPLPPTPAKLGKVRASRSWRRAGTPKSLQSLSRGVWLFVCPGNGHRRGPRPIWGRFLPFFVRCEALDLVSSSLQWRSLFFGFFFSPAPGNYFWKS